MTVARFRVVVFDDPRGPWRATWRQAFEDAVAMGLAAWDASKHEYYLAVPTSVERQQVRE